MSDVIKVAVYDNRENELPAGFELVHGDEYLVEGNGILIGNVVACDRTIWHVYEALRDTSIRLNKAVLFNVYQYQHDEHQPPANLKLDRSIGCAEGAAACMSLKELADCADELMVPFIALLLNGVNSTTYPDKQFICPKSLVPFKFHVDGTFSRSLVITYNSDDQVPTGCATIETQSLRAAITLNIENNFDILTTRDRIDDVAQLASGDHAMVLCGDNGELIPVKNLRSDNPRNVPLAGYSRPETGGRVPFGPRRRHPGRRAY